MYWLWTGTALHPEKEEKDVGLGLTLPLYVSGSRSIGWWAMFITMLADVTAFVSLVFGYFFFWTIHEDFPPDPTPGPGRRSGRDRRRARLLGAWVLTLLARRWNRATARRASTRRSLAPSASPPRAARPSSPGRGVTGLDPTSHVYPATVWLLVIWTAFHVAVGILMQLYCLARRVAGRMTARHDIDIAQRRPLLALHRAHGRHHGRS